MPRITILPEPPWRWSRRSGGTLGRIAASERFGTHKLLARTLMQAGRPADARRTLLTVLEAGADPEASWLLSRACLQEGDMSAAAVHLAQSGTYRALHPLEAEPSPYVGKPAVPTAIARSSAP